LDEVENPSIFKTGRSHPNTPLPAPLAAAPYRASDLVHWHKADIQEPAINVPYCGKADKVGFWREVVCLLLTHSVNSLSSNDALRKVQSRWTLAALNKARATERRLWNN
jgi:hypothetical protein